MLACQLLDPVPGLYECFGHLGACHLLRSERKDTGSRPFDHCQFQRISADRFILG